MTQCKPHITLAERKETYMSTIEALLQELEQEAATTRRVLERVPHDRLGWKPHDKSMSLGQLALHIATVPGAIAEIVQQSPFPIPEFTQPSATSAAELLPALDQSIARAKELLGQMDEAALAKTWRVVDGDREVLALPVGAVLRSIMLNHWYHHRGQLSVYLRQVGVPVPSIYGPSADENPFAARQASAVPV
jgi:uncharacterized damage-inducible protein DinB